MQSNLQVNRGEFGEGLTANTEPSLGRNAFEGVETKTYDPERIMKSVGQASAVRSAPLLCR